MTDDSQSPDYLPYKIIRESKIIKFNDINEIEEETTFLVEGDKKSIEDNKEYIMELPITYFRIPEKSIKEYEDFQEVKSSIELFKKLKKKTEYLNKLDSIDESVIEYLQELENTAEYNIFKKFLDFKDKEKKKVGELIQKVKSLPKVKSFIDKEKLEIENLSMLLNETKSDVLIEKIIWCFIFEEILHLKNSNLENLNHYIENEIKNDKKETRIKKIKFDETIKSEIESINIREFLERSGKFEISINYPYTKKKKLFNHNSDFRIFNLFFLQFIILIFFIGFFLFEEFNTIYFYSSLLFIILFMGLFRLFVILIKKNKRLMRGDDLLDKFNQTIDQYLHKKEKFPEWDEKRYLEEEENMKIRLFLDSLSEKLFNKIYKAIYNDLDKCIFDYKSFNPMSLDLLFENNKVLFPIKTPITGFFHKTSIAIHSSNLHEDNFSIKLKTKNIIRKNKKNAKIMNLKVIRPKNLKRPLIVLFLIVIILILYLVFRGLKIIPNLSYLLIFFTEIYIIAFFVYTLLYFNSIKGSISLNPIEH